MVGVQVVGVVVAVAVVGAAVVVEPEVAVGIVKVVLAGEVVSSV